MVINTVAHQLYSILYAFSSTGLECRAVSSSPVVLVRSICVLLLLLLAKSTMGRARSGREIVYTEASYGRAARAETARKRKKRKLSSTLSVALQRDNSSVVIVGGTPPRRTRGQIRQEASLGTPPSVYTQVGATPLSNGNRVLRGTRAPTCSDYGMS